MEEPTKDYLVTVQLDLLIRIENPLDSDDASNLAVDQFADILAFIEEHTDFYLDGQRVYVEEAKD